MWNLLPLPSCFSHARSLVRNEVTPSYGACFENRNYRGPEISSRGLRKWFLYHFISGYIHLGCWRDTGNRAVPQIEGSDPRIRGNYQRRGDAINKCFQVARQRKMVLFAVQNGGWCAASENLNGYKKYGKSGKCRNGKGGPWANDVYRIRNPIRPIRPALPKGTV